MIRISELAKICGTTVYTLRYYDTVGLLCADHIDNESGYRYYAPEAVEKYKKIVFYKDLGFSLDEIKEMFSLSDEQERKKLLLKKKELADQIDRLNHMIAVIDTMYDSPQLSYPAIRDIFDIPFVDEPEVIGKWELCGQLSDEATIPDYSEVPNSTGAYSQLIFLPGGDFAWTYFWKKGTLYRLSPKYPFAIPNEYSIRMCQGEKYMILHFMSDRCIDEGEPCILLLYRQVDQVAYTESQLRLGKDNTDLPFEADDQVVGKWVVCDFVPEISRFHVAKRHTKDCNCFTRELQFTSGGVCVKTVRNGSQLIRYMLRYTRGAVLNQKESTAEAYCVKQIGDSEYLFVQHKSGDYVYGGMEPHWYVFERAK